MSQDIFYKLCEFVNSSDLEGLTSLYHPDSTSKAVVSEQMKEVFKNYKLNTKIEQIDTLYQGEQEIIIKETTVTCAIDAVNFKNNKVRSIHILRKHCDNWLIFGTVPLEVKFIEH